MKVLRATRHERPISDGRSMSASLSERSNRAAQSDANGQNPHGPLSPALLAFNLGHRGDGFLSDFRAINFSFSHILNVLLQAFSHKVYMSSQLVPHARIGNWHCEIVYLFLHTIKQCDHFGYIALIRLGG